MSQQYSLGSGTPSSIKRRRGRPRKDESFSLAQRLIPNSPLSYTQTRVERSPLQTQIDLAKETRTIGSSIGEDEMIGRMISGVLEGAFDAGYFLSMRVSNTETYLKGLVFQPGKFVPITIENDIAPLAKMYTRMDQIQEPSKPVESVNVSNYECVQLRNHDMTKGDQIEVVDLGVVEKQPEQIMIELPNEASREKNNALNYQVLADFSNSMVAETEESIAKEKLELLATLSVEMDLPKPVMEVSDQTHEDEDVDGSSEQDPILLEPLAKKPRTEEEYFL